MATASISTSIQGMPDEIFCRFVMMAPLLAGKKIHVLLLYRLLRRTCGAYKKKVYVGAAAARQHQHIPSFCRARLHLASVAEKRQSHPSQSPLAGDADTSWLAYIL